MEKPDDEVRAFYRRQLKRLLEHAGRCHDPRTVETLLTTAKYYTDKLQPPGSAQEKSAIAGRAPRSDAVNGAKCDWPI
jgi:hypothetical protein